MFEIRENLPLAFFYIGAAYCVTFLITRRYWPLPQPKSKEGKPIYLIAFDERDFRLQSLLFGRAAAHNVRYARRMKIAEAEGDPFKTRLSNAVKARRLPKAREWVIVAILALTCLVFLNETWRSPWPCIEKPWMYQLVHCQIDKASIEGAERQAAEDKRVDDRRAAARAGCKAAYEAEHNVTVEFTNSVDSNAEIWACMGDRIREAEAKDERQIEVAGGPMTQHKPGQP